MAKYWLNDIKENKYTLPTTNKFKFLIGIEKIDNFIRNFKFGEILIIAGRTSTGKTYLSFKFAENLCFNLKKPVIFYSIELSYDSIKKYLGNKKTISHAPFIIDDRYDLSVDDLEKDIKYLKDKFGVIVVFVDYLQLLRPNCEIKDKIVLLKSLSEKMEVSMIINSQLPLSLQGADEITVKDFFVPKTDSIRGFMFYKNRINELNEKELIFLILYLNIL